MASPGFYALIAIAITVEALYETYKFWKDPENKSWWIPVLLAIVLCMATGFSLFDVIGITLDFAWLKGIAPDNVMLAFGKFVGILITGVIGSRGANYVHDFIKRISVRNENAASG